MEPRLAAQRDIEASMAPVEEMGRQQRAIAASINAGIGRQLREMFGYPTERGGPTPPPSAEALGGRPPLSPADMSALVDRVAELVAKRLAAASTQKAGPREPETKGQQGQKTREIALGLSATLTALAEEDVGVKTLSARRLAKMISWGYRSISDNLTYKSWRLELVGMRISSERDGMVDAFDSGVLRLQQNKPGRGRAAAVDPTVDPAVEKMTRQFLRHSEEGLDGH